ncbi:MAG: DUF5703 domain-containing protein [Thermoguttaceae bacterium]|nr:DUF5703 domain-containing protein [Thermoguttaceae bacterium]MDW8037543.1 DUF5703 domain-containing protein [Thermoguttaceae bacterium]
MRIVVFYLGVMGTILGGNVYGENLLDMYEVVWQTPSDGPQGSMPLGNGEVALNAWMEPSGDLRLYIARSDAWDEYGRLVKVGGVRIQIGQSEGAARHFFRQTLQVRAGTLTAQYGPAEEKFHWRVWVDAHRPVIYVEIHSAKPTEAKARLELWRTQPVILPHEEVDIFIFKELEKIVVQPDTVLTGLKENIGWYHHNRKSIGPALCARIQGIEDFPRPDPLLGRTFGAVIAASRPDRLDDQTLRSKLGNDHLFEIYVHTEHPSSPEEWLAKVQQELEKARSIPLAARRAEHEQWWTDFWNRSWIHIRSAGPPSQSKIPRDAPLHLGVEEDDGFTVARAYQLQRYMNACAGRGRYPIKFNGSLFTVPWEGRPGGPDYRRWGPGYWWQNTRLPYYTMPAAGDFDLMQPLFRMYAQDLFPLFQFRTRRYFNHDGIYIPECIYFWGDVFMETYGRRPASERDDKLQESRWHKWVWVSGLELTWLMLDYYDHTQDDKFFKEQIWPVAREVMRFFEHYYKTGPDGKLVFSPAQALETWWECVNPMPEIAGLHAVAGRLLSLPKTLLSAEDQAWLQRFQAKLPDLPTCKTEDGRYMLAPAQQYKDKRNIENPELYAVFPFRLIALGKPNLEWGLLALEHRLDRGPIGWRQDDVFMAYLGLANPARQYLVQRAKTKHPESRFPVFWGPNYDWVPDQCHGSILMKTLQAMLLQTDGPQMHLLPAWPADWDVEFKLQAPQRTILIGKVTDGKLVHLEVQPESRRKDLKIGSPQ